MNMPSAKLAKTLQDSEFQETKKKHLVIDGSLYRKKMVIPSEAKKSQQIVANVYEILKKIINRH